MPVKQENKSRYPRDWPQIRAAVLERARDRCERCGVRNYAVGYRDADGTFVPGCGNGPWDLAGIGLAWPSCEPLTHAEAREFADAANCCVGGVDDDGRRWFVVVLTIAHLDHVPEHCALDNLAAMCQRCHLRYDRAHHAATRRQTRAWRRGAAAQLSLLEAAS